MNKVVLIVDDEPANIDLIKGILPPEFKCKAAINGQIALKQLSKYTPDLLILDLLMPHMDGCETLTEIRKNHPPEDLPVLIISGTKEPDVLARLTTLGIIGFITKPIDAMELNTFIKQICSENKSGN